MTWAEKRLDPLLDMSYNIEKPNIVFHKTLLADGGKKPVRQANLKNSLSFANLLVFSGVLPLAVWVHLIRFEECLMKVSLSVFLVNTSDVFLVYPWHYVVNMFTF
jgi:hypothetical protein